MRLILIFLTGFVLTACAQTGPAAYGPADDGRFGYQDTRIESDRYRIAYAGSAGMTPDEVRALALRRAAELTRSNGGDWFRVISWDIAQDRRGGVSLGGGVGTGSYGRRGGFGVGVGGDFGRIGAQDYFTAYIEILIGSGAEPDDRDVYTAADVLSEGRAYDETSFSDAE
ncbi:MAG: hypothetical protein AAGB02_04630 [Pseudomonadota bacterium]